jgi:hypothetical protein
MKKLVFFTSIVLIVLTLAIWRSHSEPIKTAKPEESPLAFPNAIIPNLMGAKNNDGHRTATPQGPSRNEEIRIFRTYLESSYIQLPSLTSLRLNKEGDFHRVPPSVLQASEVFGEISDRLKTNPKLIREALRFYRACALNEQLVTSIRAVCTRNLKDWSKVAGINISKVDIPESIERIADVIPARN